MCALFSSHGLKTTAAPPQAAPLPPPPSDTSSHVLEMDPSASVSCSRCLLSSRTHPAHVLVSEPTTQLQPSFFRVEFFKKKQKTNLKYQNGWGLFFLLLDWMLRDGASRFRPQLRRPLLRVRSDGRDVKLQLCLVVGGNGSRGGELPGSLHLRNT